MTPEGTVTGTWMKALGVSLLLTLALECGAARLAGKRGRALLTVALANLLKVRKLPLSEPKAETAVEQG